MKSTTSILIVDDGTDDREIIIDAFKVNRGKVEYVSPGDGHALLQYLHENKNNGLPSLIMLDLNMPGKDGREALRELKRREAVQKIPAIVFTTSSSDRDKQMAYESGANCFITKPDTFNKLAEVTGCILKLWLPED